MGYSIMALVFGVLAVAVFFLGMWGHTEHRVHENTLRILAWFLVGYLGFLLFLSLIVCTSCGALCGITDRSYVWMKTFISKIDTEMINLVFSWGCRRDMNFEKSASDSDEKVLPCTTALGFSSTLTLTLMWTFGLAGFLMFPRKAGRVLDKIDVNTTQKLQLSAGSLFTISWLVFIIYFVIWVGLVAYNWLRLGWKGVHAQSITAYAKKYQR